MESPAPTHALGMFVLALAMMASVIPSRFVEPGDAGGQPAVDISDLDAPLATRVALGSRLPSNSDNLAAWRAIPGVGPALSRRLAQRASAGLLQREGDLLLVPGIGTKTSARISPWVLWPEKPGQSKPGTPSTPSTGGATR